MIRTGISEDRNLMKKNRRKMDHEKKLKKFLERESDVGLLLISSPLPILLFSLASEKWLRIYANERREITGIPSDST